MARPTDHAALHERGFHLHFNRLLDLVPLRFHKRKPYKHGSLPSPNSIRLLNVVDCTESKMTCTLETVSLDECPPYTALSYTWGSPLDTVECLEQYGEHVKLPIEISSQHHRRQVLLAGRNAFEGLYQLFNAGHRELIWVDSLCINQEDPQERAEQVGLMGDIYAKCESVIIWLGKADPTADDFVWLVKTVVPAWDKCRTREGYNATTSIEWDSDILAEKLQVESPGHRWRSVFEFYTYRRYWHRAWIVQEVALAEKLRIYCGEHSMEWSELVTLRDVMGLAQAIHMKIWEDVEKSERPVAMADGSLGGEVSRISQLRQNVSLGGPEGEGLRQALATCYGATSRVHRYWAFVLCLLAWIRPFFATDARDKIFAVLGVAIRFWPDDGVGTLVEPRYDLPAELVYQQVTAKLLESLPGLAVLSLVEDRPLRAGNGGLDLPSWVPNFSCFTATAPMILPEQGRFFNASLNMKSPIGPPVVVQGSKLLLQGFSCDVVHSAVSHTRPAQLIETEAMPVFAKYFTDLLYLASTLDPVYKTGEDRVGAFLRALIGGMRPSSALEEYSHVFYDYVLYTLASYSRCPATIPIVAQYVDRCQHYINILNEAGGTQLPSRLHVEEFSRALQEEIESPIGVSIPRVKEAGKKTLMFEAPMAIFQSDRAFFRTAGGFLGTGPKSMQEGDELWLFPDSRVFFILRPVPGENRHWLIGEAFVYGAMHGEMVARYPDRELKTACIL